MESSASGAIIDDSLSGQSISHSSWETVDESEIDDKVKVVVVDNYCSCRKCHPTRIFFKFKKKQNQTEESLPGKR